MFIIYSWIFITYIYIYIYIYIYLKADFIATFMIMCACMLSHFSCVRLFSTAWSIAHQAPLSMGFSRQGYWSGLPYPLPRDLPAPGIKLTSPASPALQEDS